MKACLICLSEDTTAAEPHVCARCRPVLLAMVGDAAPSRAAVPSWMQVAWQDGFTWVRPA